MIVPMSMVTVVCRQSAAEAALIELRGLGVLHLLPQRLRPNSEIESVQGRRDHVAAALAHLAGEEPDDRSPAETSNVEALVEELHHLGRERRELEQKQADLAAERAAQEAFGDFDPASARALAESGLAVRLYLLTGKGALPPAPPECVLQLVGRTRSSMAAVQIGPSTSTLTSATHSVREVPLPARSLSAIDREQSDGAARVARIDARLDELKSFRPTLRSLLATLEEEVELLNARAGMNEEPDLAWLGGACPTESVSAVEAAAARHGWALLVREAGPDDPVPTLLRSGAWAKQVHSVLQMLGITPGYSEPDSSALFLVFLTLFAAMLIGDAGYGSLLLIATFFVARGRQPMPQPVRLLRTMASATIVWGAITGTWFAIPSLPTFLEGLRVDWLVGIDPVTGESDALTARYNVMLLCFFLGALHLTLAHAWAALRSIKTLAALAQLGWIACTWFMFAIANEMVLGDTMPSIMWTVLLVGVALIVLFMTPLGKLKEEWFNHVMLPLSLVSNFVDVVSYLRLFAVGVAGFEVAKAFNNMAVETASGGGFGNVLAVLIVVFGHSLNLALCAMGVLVHGVRLNTLEFSAHLGLQWNGVSYRPFARRIAAPATSVTNQLSTSEE